jgi:hypothetical protein
MYKVHSKIILIMAILGSVVVGSGSNKVGEIVMSTVNGRTIARKYQKNVKDSHTENQVKQRNRFANCVMLYKVLAPGLKENFPGKNRYESDFNAFISRNVSKMPFDKIYGSAWEVLQYCRENGIPPVISAGEDPVLIATVNKGQEPYGLTVSTAKITYYATPGDLLKAVFIQSGGGVFKVIEKMLTDSDLAGTEICIENADVAKWTDGFVVFMKANRKKVSTSMFNYIS